MPRPDEYSRLGQTPGDDDLGSENVFVHFADIRSDRSWHHIENLDDFFRRVYLYHQRSGFLCMILLEIFDLMQFLFVVSFTTFLYGCVDYTLLFGDGDDKSYHKITIDDVLGPFPSCMATSNLFFRSCQILAFIFFIIRLIRSLHNLVKYWEIRTFFHTALLIQSDELANFTWHDILLRLCEVQRKHQMCIHKRDLTQLDIYHRILRFKNYELALINKEILPVTFRLPIFGDFVFLTEGMKRNFEFILFWGPWALFLNSWSLKEVYKRKEARAVLIRRLSTTVFLIGVLNLIFSPFIFIWTVLYSFFSYADMIKREPHLLGSRRWSQFAQLYLRHFNEVDHEFDTRLKAGYKPAVEYINCFTSNALSIIAQNVSFFCGSIAAVIIVLTVIDEDVIAVEYVITIATVTGLIAAVSRSLIPDDNLIFCPEELLEKVLCHVHYRPDSWQGKAHTSEVRAQFSRLFQYKLVFYLEELLSPLVTPFIIMFSLRKKVPQIVDFFRHFTIDIVGVGDVCSFAQLDVAKHGNPQWHNEDNINLSQYNQAEEGKTELSVINFKHTNPDWQAPKEVEEFLTSLTGHVEKGVEYMVGSSLTPLQFPSLQLSYMPQTAEHPIFKGNGVLHKSGPSSLTYPTSSLNTERYPFAAKSQSASDTQAALNSLQILSLHKLHQLRLQRQEPSGSYQQNFQVDLHVPDDRSLDLVPLDQPDPLNSFFINQPVEDLE